MGKPIKSTTTWKPPADQEGDAQLARIERRLGLHDGRYDKKVKAELDARRTSTGVGTTYTKKPWPVGYTPKTRNPNAPKGKRWGHWG